MMRARRNVVLKSSLACGWGPSSLKEEKGAIFVHSKRRRDLLCHEEEELGAVAVSCVL